MSEIDVCFFIEPVDCWELGIDYLGNDIAVIENLNPKHCQEKCQNVTECDFWTFDLLTHNCWLKDSKDFIYKLSNGISGPEACNTEQGM